MDVYPQLFQDLCATGKKKGHFLVTIMIDCLNNDQSAQDFSCCYDHECGCGYMSVINNTR